MAETAGAEEDCGVEVLICGCSSAYAFSGVEEEWDGEGLRGALGLEVEDFRG